MMDLVDMAMTSWGTPSLPLPTRLRPDRPMFIEAVGGAIERLADITDTFFGDVADDEAADEFGKPAEDMRGPRLLSETAPHRGLLGTGFLKHKTNL